MREIMESQNKKDGGPKATQMQKFVTFTMRGLGNFVHKFDVASYGDDMVASVKRRINARGNTLISAGILFPITHRLLQAAAKVDFGTINTGKEVEGSSAIADSSFSAKAKLAMYRLGTEKDGVPRGALPKVISDVADAAKQETKFIELLYGEEHGTDRYLAIPFFEQLHRDNPDLYTAAFVVEKWNRANVDFCEGMYEGVRRLFPLLSDTADRGDLRRVAMSEKRSKGKPIWQFPDTWEIKSKKGYLEGTVVPLLGSEYNGYGLKLETQRYINPHETKTTRAGADPDDSHGAEVSLEATNHNSKFDTFISSRQTSHQRGGYESTLSPATGWPRKKYMMGF